MSEESADVSGDIIEQEEVFFDDNSSSSNSGSALVNSFLANLLNNQNNETQLDSDFITNSSLAEVSVFPSEVRFPTSFPNIELKQKLLFSNRGMIDEHFTVRMTGDVEFQVKEKKIDLPAGNCYSLYVTFLPKTVSLFQASLIFEGRVSLIVSLLGHCVPSPLDFPSPSSPLWKFPNSKSHRTFMFTNRSFSLALDVNFSVNSQSITVDPDHLSLDPGTSDHICVTFDPHFAGLYEDPSITIQCEKSGDNVTIPLQFIGPRSCTIVDFGAVPIGASCEQTIQLKSPQIAPLDIAWPFSITNPDENGIEQTEFTFSFYSKRPGAFRQMLKFDSFDIELKGTAATPPFKILIPKKYPNRPFEIRNVADRTIRYKIVAPEGYIIDTNEVILRPNQAGKINIISESGISGSPEIIIIWNNSDGRQIKDRVVLPKDGNSLMDLTEISILDEPSAMSISDIQKSQESIKHHSKTPTRQTPKNINQQIKKRPPESAKNLKSNFNQYTEQEITQKITSNSLKIYGNNNVNYNKTVTNRRNPIPLPPNSQQQMNKTTSTSPKHRKRHRQKQGISYDPNFVGNQPGFESSSSFIPFFGVSPENQQSFELAINAPRDFSVVAPDFVTLYDDHFTSNVPFIMTCNSSPQTENTDYLRIISNGQIALQIPIISYRDTSNLEFETTILLNKNTAVLDVHNNGGRSGFITFGLSNDSQVTVTPLAKVLKQYESHRFIFNFESDPEKAKITVFTGDEIIRQIKAALRPNEFYSTMFEYQRLRPELTFIKDSLFKCDRGEIASITRKFIRQTPLRFVSNVQLTFSPANLEFNSTLISKKLIISNNGFQACPFEIEPLDDFVTVSKKSGQIRAESQVKITVSIKEPQNSALRIFFADDTYEVPIDFVENSSVIIDNKTFSASQPAVDFGQVEIGLTGESSIVLSNHTDKDIVLTIELPKRTPFSCQRIVPVEANGSMEVPIHFTPDLDDVFEATMIIESKSDRLEINLIGEGTKLEDADDQLSDDSDSDCVIFPKCEPGLLRRAKVKVSNKTNKIVQIEANSSPPFICPIGVFKVEACSYVWFPVHFLPKVEGMYEGSLEFKADNGKVTIVTLKGTCE